MVSVVSGMYQSPLLVSWSQPSMAAQFLCHRCITNVWVDSEEWQWDWAWQKKFCRGTIHKGHSQDFWDFFTPSPPCPHFDQVYSTRHATSLIMSALEPIPLPLCIDVPYEWPQGWDGIGRCVRGMQSWACVMLWLGLLWVLKFVNRDSALLRIIVFVTP